MMFAIVLAWFWILFEGWRTRRSLRYLEDVIPGSLEPSLPSLTVVVAARNEAQSIERCLRSLLAQRVAPTQVIVVDDRSEDATPRVLASLEREGDKRLEIIRIDELPEGWLGKCHALHVGASRATGDYLLFTDADVIYGPRALERALTFATREAPDLLCVFPRLELESMGEKLFALGFAQTFFLAFRPHSAQERSSRAAIGVGAFNMVRRDMYRKIGGHQSLRLTVVDDVALGKLVKYAGGRIRILWSREEVRVRWQRGLLGSIRGVEKNAFAGLSYSWAKTIAAVGGVWVLWCWPWLNILEAPRVLEKILAAGAVAAQIVYAMGAAASLGISFVWAGLGPLGSLVCAFALIRSAFLVTFQRGVSWRGSFYDLSALRKYDKLR